MVGHGLIPAALFLLAGVMQSRAGTYDLGSYGGLAGPAPRYAALFAIGAFASLGLPGFSGFIAEFQIFAGSVAVAPVRSEEHTSELQSRFDLVCRLLLEKKKEVVYDV